MAMVVNFGYTLVELLPVCCTQKDLEEYEGATDENMSVYEFTSSMTVSSESVVPVAAHSER